MPPPGSRYTGTRPPLYRPERQGWLIAIDGNTAGAAGVAEMLLQSHDDQIELLPALPVAWPAGSVRGLCARGGFAVDITWLDGRLGFALISSKNGGTTTVRYGERFAKLDLRAGQRIPLQPETFIGKDA